MLGHELSHVLSEHYYYTTALVLMRQFIEGALPRVAPVGSSGRGMYLALLEWSRAAELSADRAAALVMGDPLEPCRVLMRIAGGALPGMSFDAFLKQAAEYDSEEDLFSRHSRFWVELSLTHPIAVRRVKELMEWVQSGEYDRIVDGAIHAAVKSLRPRWSSTRQWLTIASGLPAFSIEPRGMCRTSVRSSVTG